MDIPWEDVQLFLAVAESKSLSAAARALQIAQPTVSRRIAALEMRMGEPLFARSVAGVALTAYGERLLAPARRMAEWAAEVDRAAETRHVAPSGTVRVTAPPGLASDFLAPFAAFLQERLPAVRLEVIATVRYLDVARAEADLALRFEQPPSRDLVVVTVIEHEVAAFAAESYVATLPKGYGLGDVRWIGWAPPLDDLPPNRLLAKRIPGFAPAFASDDFLVQIRAAQEGVGAIILGNVGHRFSRLGTLRPLTLDLAVPQARLFLVSSRGALAVPRVRAVADLLAAEMDAAGNRRSGSHRPHRPAAQRSASFRSSKGL
jgi:DNA-binding transcriptional LysR family regulator